MNRVNMEGARIHKNGSGGLDAKQIPLDSAVSIGSRSLLKRRMLTTPDQKILSDFRLQLEATPFWIR